MLVLYFYMYIHLCRLGFIWCLVGGESSEGRLLVVPCTCDGSTAVMATHLETDTIIIAIAGQHGGTTSVNVNVSISIIW
jgi:hypothetical protein